jgi:hypothetical protein
MGFAIAQPILRANPPYGLRATGYINPVKHGLVTRVHDWPHSSFHRDVRRGIFPVDWAGDVDATGEFGEAL